MAVFNRLNATLLVLLAVRSLIVMAKIVPDVDTSMTLSRLNIAKLPDDSHCERFDVEPKIPSFFRSTSKIDGRRNTVAGIEIGPGAFKTDPVDYPKDFLAKRLKFLLKLKQSKVKG